MDEECNHKPRVWTGVFEIETRPWHFRSRAQHQLSETEGSNVADSSRSSRSVTCNATLMSSQEVSRFSNSSLVCSVASAQRITLSSDVLTDGFVARTFTPEDAANYFTLLLRTPPFQPFLRYYGTVYHQGAWYLTRNANLVQGTSPGVPPQSTPLLDYNSSTTHGSVVPQRRWTPTNEVDFRRYVDGAALELPIFFVNRNGGIGFRLPDILRGRDRDLHNADKFAPLGGRATVQIGINVSTILCCRDWR